MQDEEAKKIVEKVKDDYDLIAHEWDLSRSRPSQLKLDLIDGIREDALVLDIGCGNAVMLPFILKKGAYYRGVDISEKLIGIARERYARDIKDGKADFSVGEATELPFRDEEFDTVISFAVLHHIPSPELWKKFFSEMRRVLRPHGKAMLTVWNLLNDWAEERFETGAQLEKAEDGNVMVPWRGTPGCLINRFVHQFSKGELIALAEEAGFIIVEVENYDRAGNRTSNGEEIVIELRKIT